MGFKLLRNDQKFVLAALLIGIFSLSPAALLPAAASIDYFVAKNGNDSNSGSINSPFLTVQRCVIAVRAGDTCNIRGGTYDGSITLGSGRSASGTSFSNPITMKSYNGEQVILQKGGEVTILDTIGNTDLYWILDGLIFDGSNGYRPNLEGGGLIAGSGNYVRVQNCELRHAVADGILAGGTHWELLNLNVYDNGTGKSDGDHGIYWGGSHLLIDGGSWHDNNNGYGIHIFDSGKIDTDDNVVRNARIYNNSAGGFAAGIIISTGHRNVAYNNLIYNNGGKGIQIDYRCEDCQAYNNTIYGNRFAGVQISSPGTYTNRVVAKNNIIYQNGSTITDMNPSSQGGTILSNNLMSNPSFTNASSGNFTLLPGSSAIGAGENLSSLFQTDFAGRARSSTGAFDIGAYAFAPQAQDITPPVVSISVVP